MKKLLTGMVGVLAFVLLLGAVTDTLVTQRLVVQQTSNLATATAASLSLSGAGTPPIITQCNASPPSGSTSKGSMCLDPTNASPWVYNGTAWAAVGGAGYAGSWSAGTYSAGSITSVASNLGGCPWLFAATTSTSAQPCYDYSDVTGITWTRNNVFAANGGVATIIAGQTSRSGNLIGNPVVTGWGSKRYVFDLSISGSADAMGIGFFDGSQSSTQTGAMVVGSYGAEIDIFNSRVYPIVNGVADHLQDVSAGALNNSHSAGATDTYFDRWFLDVVDNGAGPGTATVQLYRAMWTATISSPYTANPPGASVDGEKLFATWTIPRPSFTTWKPIVAARTGGASGTFVVERVFVRNTLPDWKPIAAIPDRI